MSYIGNKITGFLGSGALTVTTSTVTVEDDALFSADGNTIIGNESSDTLTIKANTAAIPNNLNFDSNTLFLDASNNRVGIGTASPAQKLHIYDSTTSKGLKSETDIDGSAANLDAEEFVTFSATTAASGLTFGSGDPRFLTGTVNPSDNTAVWRANNVGLVSTDSIRLYTNGGSERMRILSGGNVGIGTSSPAAKLTVNGSVRALRTDDNTQYGDFAQDSSGGFITTHRPHASLYENFRFLSSNNSGTVERMRIDTNGNVGIGASSVDQLLHLEKSSGTTIVKTEVASGSTVGFEIAKTGSTTQSWRIVDGATVNGVLEFYDLTNSATRMAIKGNGNVGIGTTSPASPLHVQADGIGIRIDGTANATKTVFLRNTGTGEGQFHTDGNMHFIQEDASRYMRFSTANTEAMRIHSSGNIAIGNTHDFSPLTIYGSPQATTGAIIFARNTDATSSNTTFGGIHFSSSPGNDFSIGKANVNTTTTLSFRQANQNIALMDITPDGNVFIGHDGTGTYPFTGHTIRGSDSAIFSRTGTTSESMQVRRDASDGEAIRFYRGSSHAASIKIATNAIGFSTAGATERMRIDSSGRLLVGKTSADSGVAGFEARNTGETFVTASGTTPLYVNRLSNTGNIATFQAAGLTIGAIFANGTNDIGIFSAAGSHVGIRFGEGYYIPTNNTGAIVDDAVDIGLSSYRYDDIYATNGTIQTSDRNEKQDIEALSEAEQRVAVAAKGLLRKFRWISSVEEKGDDARIHFGIIAQDLKAAFEAEGLDAGRYAMFINSTWTDEETGEERSRMGVRYNQLLAFIIAAI